MSDTRYDDTCQGLVESVTAYLEGTMSDEDQATFRAHLGTCPPCEVYVEQMRTTIRETGAVPSDVLPPQLCDDLVAAFRHWRDGELKT